MLNEGFWCEIEWKRVKIREINTSATTCCGNAVGNGNGLQTHWLIAEVRQIDFNLTFAIKETTETSERYHHKEGKKED